MSNFGAATLKFVCKMQGRDVTLRRKAATDIIVTVKMAPSNRFRQLAAVEEFTFQGVEYVVPKEFLDAVSFPEPKRNDRIVDTLLDKKFTIIEVIPMTVFGQICGYRIRAE